MNDEKNIRYIEMICKIYNLEFVLHYEPQAKYYQHKLFLYETLKDKLIAKIEERYLDDLFKKTIKELDKYNYKHKDIDLSKNDDIEYKIKSNKFTKLT